MSHLSPLRASTGAPRIRTERSGAVAVVTLDDPARRNVLDAALREGLHAALAELAGDPRVGAIVLTGAGGCFSAGGDLASLPPETRSDALDRMSRVGGLLRGITQLDKPVVAAVRGPAAGVAVGLVCACDVVVAGEGARILLPFTRLGLMPDGGLLHLLAGRVGTARARRLLLEAAAVGAHDALNFGLVDEVVADEDVVAAAVGRAAELARRASLAVAAVKQGFRSASNGLEDALTFEGNQQPRLFETADFLEGRKAFYEKREPRFMGR